MDLIVAASLKEILPFIRHVNKSENISEGTLIKCDCVHILITGVGILATAYRLGELLSTIEYDLIFNFGIAGSFKKELPIESLVVVYEENLADFGAETGDGNFIDIFEMNLIKAEDRPFKNKKLQMETSKFSNFTEGLQKVKGITVNRVLSHQQNINWVKKKYNPDVVSMEGAAVFYASLQHSIPCLQLRAISDYVEKRDKTKWNIDAAITVLNKYIIELYDRKYSLS